MANLAQPWHSVAADSEEEISNHHEPAHVPAFSVSERILELEELEPTVDGQRMYRPVVGVDMPGVGHVQASYGGLSREVAAIERISPTAIKESVARAETAVLRGRPYRAGVGAFPETLRRELDREDRELLLIQLIFAANRLADWSIAKRLPWGPDVCPDCGAIITRITEKMKHQPTCHVGAVTEAIEQLEYQQLKSQQAKEEASTGESGAASDGIRTPGMKQGVCMLCSEKEGGIWEGEYSDGSVNLSLLGLNQCVGPGIDGIGHTLYTHRCKGGA
jgi:hypothetical protein